jgi:hypothetical protein
MRDNRIIITAFAIQFAALPVVLISGCSSTAGSKTVDEHSLLNIRAESVSDWVRIAELKLGEESDFPPYGIKVRLDGIGPGSCKVSVQDHRTGKRKIFDRLEEDQVVQFSESTKNRLFISEIAGGSVKFLLFSYEQQHPELDY